MDPAPTPSPRHDGDGREPDRHDDDEPRSVDAPAERVKLPARTRLRRFRRDHPRAFGVGLVVVLLVLLGAILLWWWFHVHESTDDAQIDGHIAPISTRVNGTVIAVFVEDNQEVKAGQPLAALDPRDYEVAVARAEAELAQARANLEAEHPNVPITATTNLTQAATSTDEVTTARATLAVAGRDADAAQARVHAAEANDTRAQADLARAKYLIAERAITQERYDQILANTKATRAELESQRATARAAAKSVEEQRARLQQAMSRQGEVLKNAPRQLSIKQANIDARKAAVKAAEANLERARLDLSYTKITAPTDGVVGKRSAEPGQRVQPGEQLFAVVDIDNLWVTANFKETQLEELRVGQPVHIKVDALDLAIDGTVESFAGASGARYSLLPPENATGNFVKVVQRIPVRIRFAPNQDPRRRLRPGMSVEPRVRVR